LTEIKEGIKEKVKEFMFRFFRADDFHDDMDIYSMGFVNSLFAIQLVLFLENEFGIRVENIDIDVDNFKTLNRIHNFTIKKINSMVN